MQAFTASIFGCLADLGPRAAECPDATIVATNTGTAANSDRRIVASFELDVCE
jgi:hypothetical protein